MAKFNIEDHKSVFTGKFQVQISNGPKSGLIRVIDYHGANISHRFKIISHDATMRVFNLKGDHLPEYDKKVKQRGRDWLVDNSYNVVVRDLKNNPVPDGKGGVKEAPAYDHFIEVIYGTPAPLKDILIASIKLDDSNGLYEE